MLATTCVRNNKYSQLIRHLLFDLKINKLLEGKSKTIKTMHAKSCKQRKGEKIMATNWTLSQALAKITEGTDKAAIQDIGRRFPLTAVALAEIGHNAGAAKIIGAVPSHITARKIESVLKDGVEQDSDVDIEDAEDEDEAPKKETKKPAKKAANEKTDEDVEDDPVALYKKCKKAGLKVAPKKTAKYYKDQLAKAAATEEDADDDDWGDDDNEDDEKPASKKKPVKKASAKKPAKKAEPEQEDDEEDEDEWDI